MDLAAKLQLKPHQHLEIVPASASVPPAIGDLGHSDESGSGVLIFVGDRAALEQHRRHIVEAASEDRLTWVAYPKAGQLGTDLNRDSLASLLTASGVQPVRQISIDDVWSALRFRAG
ncbi:MAG TPA: hypothetical protein VGP46_06570 [Acidimicrobiales bacterium]|jgi:hypothetical protein|nr:hypothetical protein [Acidimicrobiales bacterium]